ncbi:MAG: flagellar hook-basal body complex protein FliE [bacterium]
MTMPIGGPGGRGRIGLDIASGENRIKPIGGEDANGTSFADTLKKALGGVEQSQDSAADYVGKFMRGENVELHQVMAATEEAQLSLEMLIELRNKFADAYRTVINMQS